MSTENKEKAFNLAEFLNSLSVEPLNDLVLIRPDYESIKTEIGGILLPQTAQEQTPQSGIVVAVGKGILTDSSMRIPLDVEVGDHVWYGRFSGTKIFYNDEQLVILRQDSLLFKITTS